MRLRSQARETFIWFNSAERCRNLYRNKLKFRRCCQRAGLRLAIRDMRAPAAFRLTAAKRGWGRMSFVPVYVIRVPRLFGAFGRRLIEADTQGIWGY